MNTNRLGDSIIFLSKSLKAGLENKTLELGLGIGQIQLMMTLKGAAQVSLSRKQLGEILQIHKANISRNVKRLEEKAYIVANANGNFQLTSRGEQALHTIIPLLGDLQDQMTRGISKKDLEICHQVLNIMIKNLED